MFWAYLFITVFFDIVGMTLARKAALTKESLFLFLAILAFGFVGFFMAQLLRFEGVGIANSLWAGISVLATLLIGVFYFQEKILPLQFLGIFVILCGVFMVERAS